MYGAKADRQLFLFEKCLLITKKAEDGILACKHCIEVWCLGDICILYLFVFQFNRNSLVQYYMRDF